MADQKYLREAAGSRAITAFPRANVGDTVSNIEKMLAEKAKDFETKDLIYVVDENEVLLGLR
jgi:Mg/Co/Ni transporter MgtE